MFESINRSKKIILEFNPDIIIGTGGFATFPVIYAGHKMGIKTVIHESNLVPGKALKMLENKASLILVNYEETKDFFKNKSKVKRVGNPLRGEYFDQNKASLKEKLKIPKGNKVILSFGGSLGAQRLNDAIIAMIENYLRFQENITLFFVTGKKDYIRVKNILKFTSDNIRLLDFCYNIPEVIGSSDLVISRAGAMTISELAQSKKCAILVPSPNVANNHQYKNAKLLNDNQSAILIKEDELHKLTDQVKYLMENDHIRGQYEKNIKSFSMEDSNKRICMEILKLYKK
jgi:UDP-N-acetylglucosamine--N-acetylmuramyl-(pentapeptide) pyrophosphoryl-undecaprenol N-acetylglucosamine transferase